MQETFEIIAKHLLTQGHRSTRSMDPYMKTMCLYRGPGGSKCAIGVLISDEDYHSNMEGMLVDALVSQFELDLTDKMPLWELEELQKIHDEVEPARWYSALKDLGEKYSYNTDFLKEFLK